MMNSRFTRFLALSCGLLSFALLSIAEGMTQETQRPANIVIVAIDRSMSFQARQQNAIDSTLKYLDQIASRKLGRWEGKNDKIVIISLDAMPSVLWRGNLQELKALSSADWSKQFAARSDYQRCTDVTGAFSLAGEEFANSDSGPTYKYLLVFSDLIHEPPTTSASICAKPEYAPTADFPWATLQDVSVSVFWLPVNQKLIWQRAFRESTGWATKSRSTATRSKRCADYPAPASKGQDHRWRARGRGKSLQVHLCQRTLDHWSTWRRSNVQLPCRDCLCATPAQSAADQRAAATFHAGAASCPRNAGTAPRRN